MIVNNKFECSYDTYSRKARAFLKDENGFFYIARIGESLCVPGGTLEGDEDPTIGIKREIKEEVGVNLTNPTYLGCILMFHENFINVKHNPVDRSNRLNEIHFFFSEINSSDIGETEYTDYEKTSGMVIEKYKLEDLVNILNNTTDEYAKFMAEESLAGIDLLKNML